MVMRLPRQHRSPCTMQTHPRSKLLPSLRAEVKVRTITPIENLTECIYCGSSHIVKDGIRKNKAGNIQVFNCKNCHKDFTFNIGFERMKHNPQAITSAMQLYFSGESLRNTMRSLKLLGVEVSTKPFTTG